MLDAVGEQAVSILREYFGAFEELLADPHRCAVEAVEKLQEAGLIARCHCPKGFGQVRDPNCPAHGNRRPAHTIHGTPFMGGTGTDT